jgi:hypothetical protein
MTQAIGNAPDFITYKTASNGRLGIFSFGHPVESIRTPFLFPVAFLMTGTTARGGATWKYILQDQDKGTKAKYYGNVTARTCHLYLSHMPKFEPPRIAGCVGQRDSM